MKKFLWLLVILIVAGGVSIAIYANKHKSDTTTTTDLSQVLGNNSATQQPSDNSQTLPLPNTNPTPTTPVPVRTPAPKPVKKPVTAVAEIPTTKTFLVPAANLQVTVPNAWYVVSTTNDTSLILFMDSTRQTVYGRIEIFLGSDRTISDLQTDLMHDTSVYNIRYGSYSGMTAIIFDKAGVSGDIIGIVHDDNAYYLEGLAQTQASISFTR